MCTLCQDLYFKVCNRDYEVKQIQNYGHDFVYEG